jgi:integrase
VTRQVAVQFLDVIAQLDPLWARSPAKRASTLDQLRARSVEAHEEGLSNRTLNRYISTMTSFLAWAADRYPGVTKDVFSGQWRKPSSTRKTGWLPMTDAEVLTIIDHTDQLPHDDPMFWLPRIGAYSGMRLNEVCSLRVSDVIRRDGVTCFNITGAKTEAGDRVVPVHSKLLQAGLLAYVEGLPRDGLLFPTLTPGGPDQKLSWRISPEFTRLRRRLGIDRDRVSFHSLRKSFTTKLERAHVPPTEAAQLLGHERGFTFTTYSGGLRPRRLKELVELVEYHDHGDD